MNINKKTSQATSVLSKSNNSLLLRRMYKYRYFYLMFLPVLILLIMFNYIPMIGIRVAFYNWGIMGERTAKFVGLQNFQDLFKSINFWVAFKNTLWISFVNLILSLIFSVGIALLLNEIRGIRFKKLAQTVLYLPHFLSWVAVASIFIMFLSPQTGIVNEIIKAFGGTPIYFMVSEKWWTPIYLFVNRWKETGWGTIIFVAALAGVDQEMYEAAALDGASRVKQAWYITLPAIQNTILVVFILNLAKVLNVFESVLVFYNPMVHNVADVIGTYTYRLGLLSNDYGMSTAVGLFKSVVSLILVSIANKASKKIKGEGIL